MGVAVLAASAEANDVATPVAHLSYSACVAASGTVSELGRGGGLLGWKLLLFVSKFLLFVLE